MPADDSKCSSSPLPPAGRGLVLVLVLVRTLIVDIIALILDMPTTDFICQSTVSSLLYFTITSIQSLLMHRCDENTYHK